MVLIQDQKVAYKVTKYIEKLSETTNQLKLVQIINNVRSISRYELLNESIKPLARNISVWK